MDIDKELLSLLPKNEFTRRRFVGSLLGAGFALAVQPVCAQTAISTSADGLAVGEIEVPAKDRKIPAYVAMPSNGTKLPVILVVQEIFGVHEYIKDVCRRLAKVGYMAIAPELYVRQGNPATLATAAEISSQIVSKVPDAQVMADLDACVAWAKDSDNADINKLGITGFCWGGRIVWLYAAHNPKVKAGVAWYGRLTNPKNDLQPNHPVDIVASLKAPVLGLYGGADQGIPLENVEQMRAALNAVNNISSEIVIYPDAPHAFHADYRPSYRKEAAEDGWAKLQAWFKKHGLSK